MSSLTRSSCVAAADARAAFSRRQACQGPSKKSGFGPPSSSTAVVTASRNQRSCATRITAASSAGQLPLEPLEALDVEVVRRLVEEQQVGVGRRARARATRGSARRPRTSRAAGRGRRRGTRARAAPTRRGRARPSRLRARVEPAPRCSGAASPARGRRSPSPARGRASSSSIATRSPAPESEYSRSVSPWPRGGRWSWSATRVSLANASSPPCSDVSPTSARSSVVLPAPFGPASASRSPRRSRNETPSKRGSPESSLRRPDAIRTAIDPKDTRRSTPPAAGWYRAASQNGGRGYTSSWPRADRRRRRWPRGRPRRLRVPRRRRREGRHHRRRRAGSAVQPAAADEGLPARRGRARGHARAVRSRSGRRHVVELRLDTRSRRSTRPSTRSSSREASGSGTGRSSSRPARARASCRFPARISSASTRTGRSPMPTPCATAAEEAHTAIVIGGSFIGAETAASLRLRGLDVTLVEMGSTLMPQLACPELSEELVELYRGEGIEVLLETQIEELTGNGKLLTGARLRGRQDARGLPRDRRDRRPAERRAGAEAAAPTSTTGSSWTSASGTSLPDVYAIGDVARYPDPTSGRLRRIEHWSNASAQGGHLGRQLAGARAAYDEVPVFFTQLFDKKLQVLGDVQPAVECVLRGSLADGRLIGFHLTEKRRARRRDRPRPRRRSHGGAEGADPREARRSTTRRDSSTRT